MSGQGRLLGAAIGWDPPPPSDSTELAECPSSFVPHSRNYGGQDGATACMGLMCGDP
jgi:hypothetical protein